MIFLKRVSIRPRQPRVSVVDQADSAGGLGPRKVREEEVQKGAEKEKTQEKGVAQEVQRRADQQDESRTAIGETREDPEEEGVDRHAGTRTFCSSFSLPKEKIHHL